MKMTERIRKLREQSLNAENRISAERALLITEFYQSGMADAEPVPVQRALAFKYILEHKYICVNEGELIGRRAGTGPEGYSDLSRNLYPLVTRSRDIERSPESIL